MILLDRDEIKRIVMIKALAKHNRKFLAHYDMDDGVESCEEVAKATAENILIQLQAIYNIPASSASMLRMGEFIQELMGEVK